jgi:hypothetical protein
MEVGRFGVKEEYCPVIVQDWDSVLGLQNLQRGITSVVLVQLGQVRCQLASMQQVNVD